MWETFTKTVSRYFHFLETEFGFVRKTMNPPNVIYVSDKLQVQVYYDVNGRHELDLGLRRLADDPRKPLSLGIGMLMRLKDGQDTVGYPSPFPSTEKALETEVRNLAELLHNYGSDVLKGDLHGFERMEQLDKELAKKFGPK